MRGTAALRFPTILVAATLIILGFAPAAQAEGYGLLPTRQAPFIPDSHLRSMLDRYIDTYHSTLLVFTQCFGGDFLDDFYSRARTVAMAANTPGRPSYYGGYHDDAARALDPSPGRMSTAVHEAGVAGKDDLEGPMSTNNSVSLERASPDGDIKGRHVVIYAGDPEYADAMDVLEIVNNFADESNTTVTTVVGKGSADGWDHPATLEGLRNALEEIGGQMDENDQFILFVTDHGVHSDWKAPPTVPAGDSETVSLTVTPEVIDGMATNATEDSGFMLFLPNPAGDVTLEGDDIQVSPSAEITLDATDFWEFDLDGDGALTGSGEGLGLYYQLSGFQLLEVMDENGKIELVVINNTVNDYEFSEASVLSGAIAKLGISDLVVEVDEGPNSPDAVEVELGEEDEPLMQLSLANKSESEPAYVNELKVQLDGSEEALEGVGEVQLVQDVDLDGQLSERDEVLGTAWPDENGRVNFDLSPPTQIGPQMTLWLLLTASFHLIERLGEFEVDYSHDAGTSTCSDGQIEPFSVSALLMLMIHDTIQQMQVVFEDGHPVEGSFDTASGTFEGETPAVDVGGGLLAREFWQIVLSPDRTSFSGTAQVQYLLAASQVEYCIRAFNLIGARQ